MKKYIVGIAVAIALFIVSHGSIANADGYEYSYNAGKPVSYCYQYTYTGRVSLDGQTLERVPYYLYKNYDKTKPPPYKPIGRPYARVEVEVTYTLIAATPTRGAYCNWLITSEIYYL